MRGEVFPLEPRVQRVVATSFEASGTLVHPEQAGVANAIGAAIAQIGGEAERLVAYDEQNREASLQKICELATAQALRAGARPDTLRVADIEETAMSYMEGNMARVRVKVVGDIAGLGAPASGAKP